MLFVFDLAPYTYVYISISGELSYLTSTCLKYIYIYIYIYLFMFVYLANKSRAGLYFGSTIKLVTNPYYVWKPTYM